MTTTTTHQPCHFCGALISNEDIEENLPYTYPDNHLYCPDCYAEEDLTTKSQSPTPKMPFIVWWTNHPSTKQVHQASTAEEAKQAFLKDKGFMPDPFTSKVSCKQLFSDEIL